MKICISATGPTEDSQVSPVFGRCPYFLIFDEEEGKFAAVKNEALQVARGAGIAAAQKISNLGCQVLLTGNVGPHAFWALKQAKIKIFTVSFGKSIKEVLKEYREGKLKEIEAPAGRFGFGGFGQGRRGKRW